MFVKNPKSLLFFHNSTYSHVYVEKLCTLACSYLPEREIGPLPMHCKKMSQEFTVKNCQTMTVKDSKLVYLVNFTS